MSENWAAVRGYEGYYEVSDMGRVRSVDRVVATSGRGGQRRLSGRAIRPSHGKDGRLRVVLSRGGEEHTALVHRLVASAFCAGESREMEVCHNNGNCADNRATNLRWDLHGENLRDAVRHGTHRWSSATHCVSGHRFDADNTYITPSTGERTCRICRARRSREYAERHAA